MHSYVPSPLFPYQSFPSIDKGLASDHNLTTDRPTQIFLSIFLCWASDLYLGTAGLAFKLKKNSSTDSRSETEEHI